MIVSQLSKTGRLVDPAVIVAIQQSLGVLRTDLNQAHSDIGELEVNVQEVQQDINEIDIDITAIQGDVGTLQTDVGTLQTDVGTLQTDVGTLQTDVGTLQTDVGIAQGDISNLQSAMSNLSKYLQLSIYDNGDSEASKNIDWSKGSWQKLNVTASCVLTFTNMLPGVIYRLDFKEGGSGGYTVTFPSIAWDHNFEPTWITTLSADNTGIFWLAINGTTIKGAGYVPS